jgi:hypothetical protein
MMAIQRDISNNISNYNISVSLYRELLGIADDVLDYLKNTNTFHNQLKFDQINEQCYQKLYVDIKNGDEIPPLSKFYDEINGLKDLNNNAYKYFMKKRNDSVKGLDVQLGNKFDQVLIDFFKSKGILALRADTKNKKLPDIMILDKTRNIKAYVEHKYHHAPFMLSHKFINRESYEGSITLDTEKIKKQIIECESELPNRPVYIVHWVDFHHLKGIFFNSLEQIKDYLNNSPTGYNRKDRKGDYKLSKKIGYTEKFYPPLHEMGDFEELLRKLSK